jgi:hypothetical protein
MAVLRRKRSHAKMAALRRKGNAGKVVAAPTT